MSEKPTLMLLDGNSLAYRAFYALPAENFKTKSGLTTNAQLEQHSRSTVDRSIAVGCERQARRGAALIQDALRETTHDVESLGVRIQKHQLGNIELISEPGKAVNQLWCVRRSAADDSQFHVAHPFTPVSVMPSTKTFCARKKTMSTGSMARIVAAIVRFHCTW